MLLSSLVAAFIEDHAEEGVECDQQLLEASYNGLIRHVTLLSGDAVKLSLRNKMHLRQIGKLLQCL